jgi:hypothetical protein
MGYRQQFYDQLEAWGAPRAKLLPRWERHDDTNEATIDHGAWSEYLSAYLRSAFEDGQNLMDYAHVRDADRVSLDAYVNMLGAVPISTYSRAEQLAYWINLYNARTVQLVLAYLPIDSITQINISPGNISRGPWGKKILSIEGEALSLNDVEHRIVRPIWRECRVHYALNCAAIGCPNLQPVAFGPANTEAMLEAGARAYVNHLRGARFDGGRLTVSKIYLWYAADFGGRPSGVLDHLRRYADGELAKGLAGASRIHAYDYYWALNEAP